eukprot:CAMPEP_0172473110 /NCGR_PEP_ID=MMETSP1065-20121228/68686_1 /TAXON_ID=265537 /ORGANISM="Amphiprora paludosa, Strain CCMP125" /LENGTH=660 /DNA_ID=CAMNT_0013231279 /DNA_START=2353 /DNA_END=4335 /DNA_ORIENTATION=-
MAINHCLASSSTTLEIDKKEMGDLETRNSKEIEESARSAVVSSSSNEPHRQLENAVPLEAALLPPAVDVTGAVVEEVTSLATSTVVAVDSFTTGTAVLEESAAENNTFENFVLAGDGSTNPITLSSCAVGLDYLNEQEIAGGITETCAAQFQNGDGTVVAVDTLNGGLGGDVDVCGSTGVGGMLYQTFDLAELSAWNPAVGDGNVFIQIQFDAVFFGPLSGFINKSNVGIRFDGAQASADVSLLLREFDSAVEFGSLATPEAGSVPVVTAVVPQTTTTNLVLATGATMPDPSDLVPETTTTTTTSTTILGGKGFSPGGSLATIPAGGIRGLLEQAAVDRDNASQSLVDLGSVASVTEVMTPSAVEYGAVNESINQLVSVPEGASAFTLEVDTSLLVDGCLALDNLSLTGLAASPAGTESPTSAPTQRPTTHPTSSPTTSPTSSPTSGPTTSPTSSPTTSPTNSPSASPTNGPSNAPTHSPTSGPTSTPTQNPTSSPTDNPTTSPTGSPTISPTSQPTQRPTYSPTSSPTTSPTNGPTSSPTKNPTSTPTLSPTESPTLSPTRSPTLSPTTLSPTQGPTNSPTTARPTNSPTLSCDPSRKPSCVSLCRKIEDNDCVDAALNTGGSVRGRCKGWLQAAYNNGCGTTNIFLQKRTKKTARLGY